MAKSAQHTYMDMLYTKGALSVLVWKNIKCSITKIELL